MHPASVKSLSVRISPGKWITYLFILKINIVGLVAFLKLSTFAAETDRLVFSIFYIGKTIANRQRIKQNH